MDTLVYLISIKYLSIRNFVAASFYWLSDSVLRFKRRYLKAKGPILFFSDDENKSDSEVRPYLEIVEHAVTLPQVGEVFRRDFHYREILEHVGYFLGAKYLRELIHYDCSLLYQLQKNAVNDIYGHPRTFRVSGNLKVSTTTIRYLATWYQLERILKPLSNSNWVEIGCGYGGQAAVISRMIAVKSYTMFDVPQAEKLIGQYLTKIRSDLNPVFGNLLTLDNEQTYDYAISNYAFSELPKQIQIQYLEKVLANSKHGFMIMNSGRSDISGRSKGKLKLSEIKAFLPGMKVIEEKPLSGPDNYVIIW